MDPEYSRAAKRLRENEEEPVYLAKIDSDLNPVVANNYSTNSYPYFKYLLSLDDSRFFIDGKPTNYVGANENFYDVFNWIFKKYRFLSSPL